MNAYILERLYPTGWRRAGEIHWRYSDAANAAVRNCSARAVRVLPVHVHTDAVLVLESAPATKDRQLPKGGAK